MFMKHYAPNRCEPSIEALNFRGRGTLGRCERRSEVFVKFIFFFFFFGGGGSGQGGGVMVDVNREVNFLSKFKKKMLGGGGGVRMDVNEELKFSWKFKKRGVRWGVGLGGQCRCEQRSEVFVKIIFFFFFFGGRGGGGVGQVGGVRGVTG